MLLARLGGYICFSKHRDDTLFNQALMIYEYADPCNSISKTVDVIYNWYCISVIKIGISLISDFRSLLSTPNAVHGLDNYRLLFDGSLETKNTYR